MSGNYSLQPTRGVLGLICMGKAELESGIASIQRLAQHGFTDAHSALLAHMVGVALPIEASVGPQLQMVVARRIQQVQVQPGEGFLLQCADTGPYSFHYNTPYVIQEGRLEQRSPLRGLLSPSTWRKSLLAASATSRRRSFRPWRQIWHGVQSTKASIRLQSAR